MNRHVQMFGLERPFNPRSVRNLAAWYDFSNLSSLTISTGISQANDLSGNGHHLTQGTGANQPSSQTGVRNSLAIARFDGSNDILDTSAWMIGTTSTCFLVFKPVTISGLNRDYLTGPGGDNTKVHITFYSTGLTKMSMYAGALPGTGASITPSSNTWYMMTSQFNGSSSFLRSGRSQILSGNAGSNSWVNGIRLGAAAGGVCHDSDYAEVIVYSSVLTAAEIDVVEAYLAVKWGF